MVTVIGNTYYLNPDENGRFHCPFRLCSTTCVASKINSLRKHARRHGILIRTIQKKLRRERLERVRKHVAVYRERKKISTIKRTTRRQCTTKKYRLLYDEEDAIEHGLYRCRMPFLNYQKSRIANAGNGVFALRDFIPGDVVTIISGTRTPIAPVDRSYTIQLPNGYIDGLRVPKRKSGLGTFINREDRSISKARKNCEIVIQVTATSVQVFIQVTKKIRAGDELYLTYSRGYRIHK